MSGCWEWPPNGWATSTGSCTVRYRAPRLDRNWIECIKWRETPVADVEAGARTATIAILRNLAYWNRRPMRFDPQRWRFVDDAETNTWLDYERRDPWQLPSV